LGKAVITNQSVIQDQVADSIFSLSQFEIKE